MAKVSSALLKDKISKVTVSSHFVKLFTLSQAVYTLTCVVENCRKLQSTHFTESEKCVSKMECNDLNKATNQSLTSFRKVTIHTENLFLPPQCTLSHDIWYHPLKHYLLHWTLTGLDGYKQGDNRCLHQGKCCHLYDHCSCRMGPKMSKFRLL